MRRALSSAILSSLLAVACGDGAPSDSSLEADLRIEGAQFYPGPMPVESGGPKVLVVELTSNIVKSGQKDRPLEGALEPAATAAAIGLVDDKGFFIVPAGLPDVDAPDFPTFKTTMAFAPAMPPGERTLVVRAVDPQNRFGEPSEQRLTVLSPGLPQAELVVALSWDTNADLDLHVVDPSGVEIFARDPSSFVAPLPGQPPDPQALERAGRLDFDSNGKCVVDALRREHIFWPIKPPVGRYLGRVDTFSLCGESAARWRVEVWLRGALIASSVGLSLETDAQQSHDRGAGVLAVEFEVP